ncbi:hypothetical protein SS50377_23397 [Spironucleus salmonicida]|uniref:Uncharacterized protein n=1 Tax=Spironucleus salmonicida TaxID=348837 RepID=V6LSP4_9EUKA|nr:hypothetical protein SS50377_23397 [Spironucleus salmonicida]|eukprot:EST47268.1 Hypothetical protein SS50377_jh005 [Spironucleus salmonicida]
MSHKWRFYSIPLQIDYLENYMEFTMHMPVIKCSIDQLASLACQLEKNQMLNIKPLTLKQQVQQQVHQNELQRKKTKNNHRKQEPQTQQSRRIWRNPDTQSTKQQDLIEFLKNNQKLITK